MRQTDIWDSINETQTIFKEREVFSIEYFPDILKHRDQQLEIMTANCKEELDDKRKPYHMILHGNYATGKTITIKKFFHEVEKKYPWAQTVHINCKNHRTAYHIYLKIYEKIFNKKMSVGGLSTFTILNKIINKISKTGIILIVALDDINNVKSDRDLNNVLYNLLRASETNQNAKITVFSVTNDRNLLFLDPDVQTVFGGIQLGFPNYLFEQIHDILKERCHIGLYDGAISNEIIESVANYTHEIGDLRKGLNEIYKAGLNAEFEGNHKISKKHFQ